MLFGVNGGFLTSSVQKPAYTQPSRGLYVVIFIISYNILERLDKTGIYDIVLCRIVEYLIEVNSMNAWLEGMCDPAKGSEKKPLPVLSFPCVSLMGVTVRELLSTADAQAKGMVRVAERTDAAASVSFMDLSIEAEAFGAQAVFYEREVPAIRGRVVETPEQAEALRIPQVGEARTGRAIDTVRLAKTRIHDRPVLAGMIGPFSLAGRLMDITEIMIQCYDEPEMVHEVLEKCTAFLTAYARAFREIGADGVFLAEPLAGLLSPALALEFSAEYIRAIIGSVRSDGFAVIYHNCGGSVPQTLSSILSTDADAYHFGDAIDLPALLPQMPSDRPVMGNISPVREFQNGTPESMRQAVRALLRDCAEFPNFVLSSGCDLPPLCPWENIDAFFDAARTYRR